MKTYTTILVLFLAGCSTASSPISQLFAPTKLIDGNFYSVSQSNCAHYSYSPDSEVDRPKIDCYSNKGEFKGAVTGLTPDQYLFALQLAGALSNAYQVYKENKNPAYLPASNIHTLEPIKITSSPYWSPKQAGTPVFSADQCKGSVTGGVCYGSIISTKPLQSMCHGSVILGKCNGALLHGD
jgi:hypothetical protein